MSLRLPLQVWLPRTRLTVRKDSPTLDQVKYAYCAYKTEGVVCFDGSTTDDRRARIDGTPFWELAVPGEPGTTLLIDVYHVGRNGYVWGPHSAERFPNSSVNGLLTTWLAFKSSADESSWAAPLASILPAEGPGLVEAASRSQMVAIAEMASAIEALPAAASLAFPYITEAYGAWYCAEWAPDWVERGRIAAWAGAEDRDRILGDRELFEALNRKTPALDQRLKAKLAKDPWLRDIESLVPLRRCWGIAGLFWALFMDHLESRRGFNMCLRCRRLLAGSRLQCGESDDRRCYLAGLSERQRRSREKRMNLR